MTRDFSDRITWIALADGKRALVLKNDEPGGEPSLSVVSAEQIDNPPTRHIGTGAAGRNNDGRAGGVRKSAYDNTDFHQLAEDRFAADFAKRLNKAAQANAFDKLLIAAPAKTLGELRSHYGSDLKKRLVGELDRDLTGLYVADIERHVADALKKANA